jgi:hypothetical protein
MRIDRQVPDHGQTRTWPAERHAGGKSLLPYVCGSGVESVLLAGQQHLDKKSATRPDETGAAATVRCRCDPPRLRESAACSRDSAQLSARKRGREGIGFDPILHPMHGTASRTNASDHGVLLGQARVSWRTVSQRARLLVPLRRHPSVCLPDRHIGTVFRLKFQLQPPTDRWSF